jgi:hypothetical protein
VQGKVSRRRRRQREPEKPPPCHPDLEAINARLKEANDALFKIADERREKLEQLVREKLPTLPAEASLSDGIWSCEGGSPSGTCVYDTADFDSETCLFCGEPQERK